MCNTWRNVFLQSMKNNTLSVKKLMKNLILRTLRQLYAVSEIIILIRWVTPPPKVEIPQLFKFFNFALSSLFPSFFFIGYIYIRVYVLYNIYLWLFLQVGFSAKWMWFMQATQHTLPSAHHRAACLCITVICSMPFLDLSSPLGFFFHSAALLSQ